MEKLLSYEGYHLVFEERFDGTELERSSWNVELHEPGWVNEELQRYVDCPDNICLRGGKLLIRPVKRSTRTAASPIPPAGSLLSTSTTSPTACLKPD